ncbi:hypothetical protein LINGRAHAP2_LOCUS20040 [Linum grandiflorum]
MLDPGFWADVGVCIRATLPLIKVLRLVDSENSPSIPFLFFELKQAKEKIISNFNHNETRYKPILNIIDQMSRPLHYVAYWLNSKIHYSAEFNPNDKLLKKSLYECVHRLTWNYEERLMIMEQLDLFTKAKRIFSEYGSKELLQRKHIADWWNTFGDDILEIQKFAIRILSMTTSASRCESNFSVFEMANI